MACEVPWRCALSFNRDNALRTVTQVVNRQLPIQNGVTILVFRPQLALDGVSAVLEKWALNHSYQWTEAQDRKVSVLDVDFHTVGFSVLIRKGLLPADHSVERMDVSAGSCAGQLFADKVVDLFNGETDEGVADGAIVMTIRHGNRSIQAAAALRATVAEQLGCGREGMQIRSLHSAPLCKQAATLCQIDRITREA